MNGSNAATPAVPNRLKVYKSNSRSKWVTREIAALEFLLGISLEEEQNIVRTGWMQQQGIVEDHSRRSEENEEKVEVLEPPTQHQSTLTSQSINSHHGRWWEKWVNDPTHQSDLISRRSRVEDDLDDNLDTDAKKANIAMNLPDNKPNSVAVSTVHAPGRRLQGDEATKVQIPIADKDSIVTRQKNIARIAFTREWEVKVAHGIGDITTNKRTIVPTKSQKQVRPPMLDGRLFFSTGESYPIGVFSLLRYEPKKEEAARRRQKLEERGGGGTQFFIMPVRDWRGISYRALLPSIPPSHLSKHNSSLLEFDRFVFSSSGNLQNKTNADTNDDPEQNDDLDLRDKHQDDDSMESNEDDVYVAGLLDDPEMVQGRHRNVMVGDRVTGPIISSTIQFVKPALLKADLNKQFRERFDGWEPPRSQRKYIGAKVVDGVYTLMDPGAVGNDDATIATTDDSNQQTAATTTSSLTAFTPRKRQNSVSSMSTAGATITGETKEVIRMPPSLTLSKIRSVKHQALMAAVQAKLEVSTVALAIVYFERLCLDCRVDKSNRRLSFAACLLLALKMNEAHVELVIAKPEQANAKSTTTNRIQSLIRPSKKSGNIFASLLEFFTQDWNLSLKHLFAAEWGVFAALQFNLHAKPSQVAFHFRRLLKAMDWNPRGYLGSTMYSHWLDALSEEEYQRVGKEERRKAREERKERNKIIRLQRELEGVDHNENGNKSSFEKDRVEGNLNVEKSEARGKPNSPSIASKKSKPASRGGIGRILTHFAGGKKALSSDKLIDHDTADHEHKDSLLTMSPSMPVFPTVVDNASDVKSEIGLPMGDEDVFDLSPDVPVTDRGLDDDDAIIV